MYKNKFKETKHKKFSFQQKALPYLIYLTPGALI